MSTPGATHWQCMGCDFKIGLHASVDEQHRYSVETGHYGWMDVKIEPPREKFPARIVLGEGWPYKSLGLPGTLGLWDRPWGTPIQDDYGVPRRAGTRMFLGDLPVAVERDPDCPRYRLVLERVYD